jgi:folate-binding protein YgfZ
MKGPLVIERSRGILRIAGRDPVKMIHGLATADIVAVTPGQGAYTAFLTPKGRMVADARTFLDPDALSGTGHPEGPPALLLDTAPDALPGLVAHIARYVPPLFARAEDVSDGWAVLGVYGTGADGTLATAFPVSDSMGPATARPAEGEAGDGDAPASPGRDAERVVALDPGFAVRTFLTGDPGWDVFVPADRRDPAIAALLGAGGRPGDPDVLEALRVVAGVPRWGRELTEEVIPLEAGLLDRAISQTKGCYTGQEVIVRIIHRGHVNRSLRRLEFAGPPPEPGTELFEEGVEKARGVVTSAVANDVGALGLGYVRREVEPPAELRVGSPDGDPVQVTPLD